MLVRAIATGYHGKLREPGTPDDTFDVPDGSKASWYVPVDEPAEGKQAASGRATKAGNQGAARQPTQKPAAGSPASSTAQSSSASDQSGAKQ